MSAGSGVTNRRVFAIAGPAMLANLTTPLLGVVATTAIGQLGDPHLLGGVALASVAFDCLFWLFGFLRMATLAFTAQALGSGDTLEIRAVLARALLLGFAIGLALIALRTPLATLTFTLMGGSDAVTAAARQYFFIRLWSAPLMLGNYVVLGWLVGQARTGIALAIQVGINCINMALTAFLVLVAGQGIAGAAIATVTAESCGFVVGLIVAWQLLGRRLGVSRAMLLDRAQLSRLFVMNRDIMIRTAALIAAFLVFSAQSARAGDLTLAANAVLNNFLMIGSFFLDGLASAAEQLCGRSFGARNRRAFAHAVRLVLIWSALFGAAVTGLFTLFGNALIDFITASPEIRVAAREAMWLAALAPLCGVAAYAYDGIYIGATWAREMRNLMLIAFAAYLGALYLLAPFGNSGLWTALLLFLLCRGALQALRYPAMVRVSFPPGSG
ncbi:MULTISPECIES: MATE family efflux transporter [Rhodopseudomonas]|uniref:XRE family transcriptional regulator n=1 Tax=Rhodopseudomonas palustris TaxID=1076 RepID=A0A0D7EFH5_RHOPL|nr:MULTISPECIES: MATE family efflux transporter [Rhodopseudomonas]KIZ39493.1 XRE family transcriptional regulator [Rhodopseudomonas palustris]MDF3811126.1 MATE family efflux transporter [Rhodopseudomonas sp. BAL398]WOK17045.1 MATE family efflux transporter [Rhodopseudomonas sp. BAL398]